MFLQLEDAVRRARPKIVGIYANIITRENVFRLARMAKDNGVEFVVCGGPDAPEWADLYFQNGVDIVGTSLYPTGWPSRWPPSAPAEKRAYPPATVSTCAGRR